MATLALGTLLAGCVASPAPVGPSAGRPVEVQREGTPLTYSDGAEARRLADLQCGGRGVRSSIYDRYDDARAAWVFVEGCA